MVIINGKQVIKYIFCVLILIFWGCSNSNNPVDDETTIEPEIEAQVHSLINEYRIASGLQPLMMNTIITDQCRLHSQNMALKKVELGHKGFTERVDKIKQSISWKSAAENVAYNNDNQNAAQTVVTGWLNSPGHRNNIEGTYNLTGIGVIKTEEGFYYFTQIFILTQ
jgi:uncharacterized protein YkwD